MLSYSGSRWLAKVAAMGWYSDIKNLFVFGSFMVAYNSFYGSLQFVIFVPIFFFTIIPICNITIFFKSIPLKNGIFKIRRQSPLPPPPKKREKYIPRQEDIKVSHFRYPQLLYLADVCNPKMGHGASSTPPKVTTPSPRATPDRSKSRKSLSYFYL